MNILVNALSVTNQSGRHVLMGHLNQLRRWTQGTHRYTILYHRQNRDMVARRPEFRWMECPSRTAHWRWRWLWEIRNLPRIVRETVSDFVFTPAGVAVPAVGIKQVVLCQNPWCLVPNIQQSIGERLKACVQRVAYKRTMADAKLMVFNSGFMQHAYHQLAGTKAENELIAYQGIGDETFDAANSLGKSQLELNHIVSVSAMAPHKGADTLVRALKLVRDAGVDARLTLAGTWPAADYRRQIEGLVDLLDLRQVVHFAGWVSQQELWDLYSRAHVFALLSRCESFGIPAVEAQCFGTPAIGTDTCAIPEIGGEGGLYSRIDDARLAANNLIETLTDDQLWSRLSRNAIANASRFRWEACSRPLLKMFELAAS